MEKNCRQCGKLITNEKSPSGFCSSKCYDEWSKFNKTPNCKCAYCGKEMYLKPSRIKRAKNGVTCSMKCAALLRSKYMSGAGNHQFGLTGDKNSSFKGVETISNYGYILEYCPNHPYPHDKSIKGTRVLQHRLVVERNYSKFDPKYFEIKNGITVLKQCYDVHHIDENKQNNTLENLEILTRGEHTSHHNKEHTILRDNQGKIVGVVKLGNIGEGFTANPEINSEIAKGSESSYSVGGE